MSPVSAFTPRWQRLRSLPGRIPLRIKLITAVLALVAIALTAISIAGISVLRGYLLAGYDGQLQLVQGQAEHTVAIYVISPGPNPGPLQFEGGAIIWIPDGTHRPVQIAEPVRPRFPDSRTAVVLPGPKVPSSASWLAAHQGTPVTVPAQSGGDRWRGLLFRQSLQNLTGGLNSGTVLAGGHVTRAYNHIRGLGRNGPTVSEVGVTALAGAAWTLGMVQRSAGDTDGALTLVTNAAALLAPRLEDGTDELRAMAGALHLHAATTCAWAGREGDAWRYWDNAAAMAERLGGYHHRWTIFGAGNVALHAVSVSADLSRSAAARARAEQIDPEDIPSRERRGRLAVEIARSYHQHRDYPAALHWLEQAYQTSADSVRYSPTARQMTADAVNHGGPLISRRARSLAGSLSLPL